MLISGNESILALKFDVHGRASHEDAEFAGCRVPVVLGGVVVRKGAAIEQYRDLFGFSGAQGDLCAAA